MSLALKSKKNTTIPDENYKQINALKYTYYERKL